MPPEATAHMEAHCDHSHKHPPCKGHSDDGELRTRASATSTLTLVMMLVGVVAILAGVIAVTPVEETGKMCNYIHRADQDY